jgi:hypothetical protein
MDMFAGPAPEEQKPLEQMWSGTERERIDHQFRGVTSLIWSAIISLLVVTIIGWWGVVYVEHNCERRDQELQNEITRLRMDWALPKAPASPAPSWVRSYPYPNRGGK